MFILFYFFEKYDEVNHWEKWCYMYIFNIRTEVQKILELKI